MLKTAPVLLSITTVHNVVLFCYFEGDSPTVWYGTSKNKLESKATATTKTYKREDMCAFPATTHLAFIDPGLIHDALMVDLKPDAQYFYQFGSDKVCTGY